ncbi:RNA-binding cell elongation regulator Jag/EloR [Bombilactobacillus thymidiniphilus]|uniref:RNA-binding protein KhpB n=1 Tax=Bombilactobacillus thymidiniphilus TaxID=2923363 RepID=A0ABY4PBQ5_9LACO|nr:RNA-binding cell elongation regulator Jag/EloR [Bombilactobacillus thymidiniphilus]UQS82966.1 Jag N-terminal domain-containing protein [Bombilactobacillus thymidiniphilus]
MTQFQGATIQKAIARGLEELNTSREQVSVDVIREGRNGFLGFGRKSAIVDLNPIESVQNILQETSATEQIAKIKDYLTDILAVTGRSEAVECNQQADSLKLDIITVDDYQSYLIGKHGKNINALQTIVQEYAYCLGFREQPILLDTGDYRKRRQEALISLSTFKADQVCATKKAVYLDPMPAVERKIIYQNLQGRQDITVRTHGRGLDKYLVIRPFRHAG